MDIVKIRTGGTEVIASGTVISFGKSPIEFEFDNLKLIFEFHDDILGTGVKETRVEGAPVDNNTLKLTLHNFNNPLGAGSTKPVPLGVLGGRKLFLQYRVYSLGDADKTLQYTIYLGEGVAANA